MANVHIGPNFTITSVNMCTNVAEDVWYQVEYIKDIPRHEGGVLDGVAIEGGSDWLSCMYVTPLNDEKFPKDLAKEDLLANVLPEIITYNEQFNESTLAELSDWETEA